MEIFINSNYWFLIRGYALGFKYFKFVNIIRHKVTKPIEKPTLIVPPVDTLTMKEVKWIVVTEENLDEVIADLKKSGQPLAIFGLSGQGYENLSTNFSAIRALVQQQQTIIAAYKQYYESSSQALDEANAQIESTQDDIDRQQKINKEAKEPLLERLNPFKN